DIGPVDALKQSAGLLRRTWGENAVGQVGIGAAFGLLSFGAVLVSVLLVVLAAQASVALAIVVGVACLLGVLLLGVYQAALTGIYSAVLYRYAISHEVPEAFRGTDIAHAFAPKRGAARGAGRRLPPAPGLSGSASAQPAAAVDGEHRARRVLRVAQQPEHGAGDLFGGAG